MRKRVFASGHFVTKDNERSNEVLSRLCDLLHCQDVECYEDLAQVPCPPQWVCSQIELYSLDETSYVGGKAEGQGLKIESKVEPFKTRTRTVGIWPFLQLGDPVTGDSKPRYNLLLTKDTGPKGMLESMMPGYARFVF